MLQHQSIITVTHDGSGFTFPVGRTKDGGGKTGEATVDRPGGMAPPEAFAGTYEFEEGTVGIGLRHERDSGLLQKANDLYGERFTVTEQPTDPKGRPGFHRPIGHSGILTGSTLSDFDANGNDRRTLDLTFTFDSVA